MRSLFGHRRSLQVVLAIVAVSTGIAACGQTASTTPAAQAAPSLPSIATLTVGQSVVGGQYADVTLESTEVHGASKGIALRITNSGSPADSGNGVRDFLLTLPHGPINLSGSSTLDFWVDDTEGANTVYVFLGDTAGHRSGLWTAQSSVPNTWVKLSVPIQSFSGVNLSKIVVVGIGEWNAGTYYFDGLSLAH